MAFVFMLLVVLVVVFPLAATVSELPHWHMKPIGSHVEPKKVDETFPDSMITTEDFANKYVLPRKPLVFRNVVQRWPAFKLWTDEYLKETYGDMELRLEAKKEKGGKIPKGDVCLGRDRLRTFLNDYKGGGDKYVVSELPTPMWKDVNIPPPMGCGAFITNFVEIDVWINSDMGKDGKGGNSILHKDAFNSVNCVVNGSKSWKLFELQYNDFIYQSWEGASEAGYGGFSLVNPDKVDATEFPNFGKIPQWQFVHVNAGDCLYLPSQMWHQVKSYGESNKAVAFLFNRFADQEKINTSNCPAIVPDVLLSDVDVDLQYPGTGLMTMGDNEIVDTQKELLRLVDQREGKVTKRNVFKMVYAGNAYAAKQKEISIKKAAKFYQYLLSIAEGDESKMTREFIANLTRNQVRSTYKWIFREEPSNSYNYEYFNFDPERIMEWIVYLQKHNGGKLEKHKFVELYESEGGTLLFAETFWKKLAGDAQVVTDVPKTIKDALELYEYYSLEEDDEEDEEATITTPQGHISEPKKRQGTFNNKYDDNNNNNGDDDDNDAHEENEESRKINVNVNDDNIVSKEEL